MSDERAKADLLAEVPLFSACTRAELNHIAQLASYREADAGEVLVREGEESDGFFVIVDGSATVARGGDVVATIGSGEFFGELALLRRGARSATVTVEQPSRLLTIEPRPFQAMVLEHPMVALKMLQVLASRVTAAEDRSEDRGGR